MHSSPLRLAYLFDQRLPCTATDTEQVLNTLAALSRAGVDVTLTLPKDWVRADADSQALLEYYQVSCPKLTVKRLRSLSPGPRWVLKPAHAVRAALFGRLNRKKYDVFYTRNAPAMITGLLMGLPVVYETYRPWPIQLRFLRGVFRWAMTRKTFVGGVFHSDFARQTYEDLGVAPERLEVVHNGFDPARFDVDPGTTEARKRCQIDTEGLVFAYTGRVNLNKGLGIVLDLAERHPDVTFLIVGSEGEGEVESRAAGLDNVLIKPWATYSELPDYLFAADVLMIPPSQGPLAELATRCCL
jgi:glycosyltransferase involved in cell wall biosynthesis